MRVTPPPPFFFNSWGFRPLEAWCFCHMAVHGDSNSHEDGPVMEGQEFVWAWSSNEQTFMFVPLWSLTMTEHTKNIYAAKG